MTAAVGARATAPAPPALLTPLDFAYLVYLYPGRLAGRVLPPALFMRVCHALIPFALGALGGARHRVASSMRAAFPEASEDQVQGWAGAAVEGFLIRAAQDLVTRRLAAGSQAEVRLQGVEHLEAARAAGRGVVVCSGHFLAARFARCWLAERGMEMLSTRRSTPASRRVSRWGRRVLQPAYQRFLHEVIRDEVFVEERGSALRILQRLREGGIVYAHLDADSSPSTTRAFLGRFVEFGAGLLQVIHLTRAPLVPVAFVGDWRRLDIEFFEPLALADTSDRGSFVRENTPRIMAALEGLVRRHPDQWEYWMLGWPAPLDQGPFGKP